MKYLLMILLCSIFSLPGFAQETPNDLSDAQKRRLIHAALAEFPDTLGLLYDRFLASELNSQDLDYRLQVIKNLAELGSNESGPSRRNAMEKVAAELLALHTMGQNDQTTLFIKKVIELLGHTETESVQSFSLVSLVKIIEDMKNIESESDRLATIEEQTANIQLAIESAAKLSSDNPENNNTYSPLNEFLKLNRESLMTAEILAGFFRGITTHLHSGTVDVIYGILNQDIYKPVLDLLLGNKPIMINGQEFRYRQEIRQKFNQCLAHPPTAIVCVGVILTAFTAPYFVVAISVVGLFSDRIIAYTGTSLIRKGIKPLLFVIDFTFNGGVHAFAKLSSEEMAKFFYELKEKGVLGILNERKNIILANSQNQLGRWGSNLINRARNIQVPMSLSELSQGLISQGAGIGELYSGFLDTLKNSRDGISETGVGVLQTLQLLLNNDIPNEQDTTGPDASRSFTRFLAEKAGNALSGSRSILNRTGEGISSGTQAASQTWYDLTQQVFASQNSYRCENAMKSLLY